MNTKLRQSRNFSLNLRPPQQIFPQKLCKIETFSAKKAEIRKRVLEILKKKGNFFVQSSERNWYWPAMEFASENETSEIADPNTGRRRRRRFGPSRKRVKGKIFGGAWFQFSNNLVLTFLRYSCWCCCFSVFSPQSLNKEQKPKIPLCSQVFSRCQLPPLFYIWL